MTAASETLGAVADLLHVWRYPVSSCRGEMLRTAEIDETGIVGDRVLAIVDRESGRSASPERERRWHPTPQVRARYGGVDEILLQVGDGDWFPLDDPGTGERLKALFGFDVDIRPYAASSPDVSVASPRYNRRPLHLISTATLATLQSLLPNSLIDERRFRPNLTMTINGEAGPFPEAAWIGRRIRLGSVELTVTDYCNRCSFTTMAQDDLPVDPNVLRTLIRSFDRRLGVLCHVVQPGIVAVGDPIVFSDV